MQSLWERVHQSKSQREETMDTLPMRCDLRWYRNTFLEAGAPGHLTALDDIWPYVKTLKEYNGDGMAVLLAVASFTPSLLDEFFGPHVCEKTNLRILGVEAGTPGIVDINLAGALLHELTAMVIGGGGGT